MLRLYPVDDGEQNNVDEMVRAREERQQNVVNYALTLDVLETRDHRPKQNAPGVILLKTIKPRQKIISVFLCSIFNGMEKRNDKGKEVTITRGSTYRGMLR